jgi:UDP-N-acetylmuramyl pentapeptide synthase
MLELGADELRFHAELGAHVRASGVDLLVTVGPLAAAMAESYGGPVEALPDAATAAERLPELLAPGDTVLLKGSRGVGLEVVAEAVRGA